MKIDQRNQGTEQNLQIKKKEKNLFAWINFSTAFWLILEAECQLFSLNNEEVIKSYFEAKKLTMRSFLCNKFSYFYSLIENF